MHSDWNDEGALVAALKSHQNDAFEFAIRRFGKNMLATARARSRVPRLRRTSFRTRG